MDDFKFNHERDGISKAVKLFCEEEGLDFERAIVGAGAAMYLQGISEDFSDVDVFHPDMVGKKVSREVAGYEIDCGGGELSKGELQFDTLETGVRMQTLSALLAFYSRLNRSKDQERIKTLDACIQMLR